LWCKITSLIIENDIGEIRYTGGRKGVLTSDKEDKHQLKRRDQTRSKHWPMQGSEFDVCVLLKTKKVEQNSIIQNVMWHCLLGHVLTYVTLNGIFED
jgi:hypothetical protein